MPVKMQVTVIKHNDLYATELDVGSEISFGSHKKDHIYVAGFQAAQIRVSRSSFRPDSVLVETNPPFAQLKAEVDLEKLHILDRDSDTRLYVSYANRTRKSLKIPYNCVLELGRSEKNDVILKNSYVSGKHLVIRSVAGKIHVEDKNSTNGTYLNGKRITAAQLHEGDILNIIGIRLVFTNNELFFENILESNVILKDVTDSFHEVKARNEQLSFAKEPEYRRSPRIQEQLPSERLVLASPPSKAQKFSKGKGIFSMLAGSSVMMAASAITMGTASPALLAARAAYMVVPTMNAVSGMRTNKRQQKQLDEYTALRMEKYKNYIQEQQSRIELIADKQRQIITKANPEPQECLKTVMELKTNLWERMFTDSDFMELRIGMGYEDLCVEVLSRAEANGVRMEDDELLDLADGIIEATRIVDNVPARVDFKKYATVGVFGQRKRVLNLVRNMLIEASTLHAPTELKIVCIVDANERREWQSIKWLPHVWDDNRQFRFFATNEDDVHIIDETLEEILKERQRQTDAVTPHYLFVFASQRYAERMNLMKYLFDQEKAKNVSTIFLYDERYSLPNECSFMIDVDNGPIAYPREAANMHFYFTIDKPLEAYEIDDLARRQFAIKQKETSAVEPIPSGISFLAGYGVSSVEALSAAGRWRENRNTRNLSAPLGMLMGNQVFSLDIHEKGHGPHGLIAGSTGSGKSELMISWVLSMALNYHPHDVNFVIIDYKGGGMSNTVAELPHVVGTITNLGNNVARAMESLNAENVRRQRLFSQYGVNSIDDYRRIYQLKKTDIPLPHMIIIVDEFAELKREMPEVMQNMIEVARIGRSLGIHLILATQSPGGIVDEQIKANTNLRLCMKVRSATDSKDMIDRVDAAQITQTGRTYVKAGNDEVFELFQAFWSGAPYQEGEKAGDDLGNQVRLIHDLGQRQRVVQDDRTRISREGMETKTELKVITEYIIRVAEENGIEKLRGPWNEELETNLTLEELEVPGTYEDGVWKNQLEWLQIPIGKYDSPRLQKQGTLYLDFAEDGHYKICGAPGMGKTTLLKSIAVSLGMYYSPEDVNIYVMDFGGWQLAELEEMPHCGGVVLDYEEEKFMKLRRLLLNELETRKHLFRRNYATSLKAYRKMGLGNLPAIFLLVDNMPAVFETYQEAEQFLTMIATQGAPFGIYLVYTSNTNSGVRSRIYSNVKNTITFAQVDKGDYHAVLNVHNVSVPLIKGRAVLGRDALEFQAALPIRGEDDFQCSLMLRRIWDNMKKSWNGILPKPIPVMPEVVSVDRMKGYLQPSQAKIPLGLSFQDIMPISLDLSEQNCMLVAGQMYAGKSNLLFKIMGMLKDTNPESEVYIFDSRNGGLKNVANSVDSYCVDSDTEAVERIQTALVQEFTKRQRGLENASDVNAYVLSLKPIYIFIDDLKDFVDAVSNEQKDCMERICRFTKNLGVMIFAAGRATDIAKYNLVEGLTKYIVSCKKGVMIGGNPGMYSFYKMQMSFVELNNEIGKGNALVYNGDNSIKIKLME